MSSQPTSAANARNEIRIVSHSTMFYWWPVWAVGFLMAAISGLSHYYMAVVPKDSKIQQNVQIDGFTGKHDVLVLPEKRAWPEIDPDSNLPREPHLIVSDKKGLGVVFCFTLLIVIGITNVALRGLWSVIVIMFVISLAIIFGLLDWWDRIVTYLGFLDIRMNMGGYLLISSVLFGLWLIVTLLFDKQIYMVFTPGQLRVRLEIGEAETAYDTAGMTIQKQRSDLFRHWILGFGSGDLIVKTSGAQAHTFDMPNVLFLGRRVHEIENMLRARPVVAAQQ